MCGDKDKRCNKQVIALINGFVHDREMLRSYDESELEEIMEMVMIVDEPKI